MRKQTGNSSGKRRVIVRKRRAPPVGPEIFPVSHQGGRMLMFGRSQTGKTFTLILMLVALRHQLGSGVKIVIISPTLTTDKTWKKAKRKHAGTKLYDIHFENPTPDVISKINGELRIQKRWATKPQGKKPPYLVIVLDDLGSNMAVRRAYLDNPFRNLFTAATHKRTLIIDLVQDHGFSLKESRINSERICITRVIDRAEKELYAKSFLGHLTKRQIQAVFHDAWDPDVVGRNKAERKALEFPILFIDRSSHGIPKIYRGFFNRVDITPNPDDEDYFHFYGGKNGKTIGRSSNQKKEKS